MLSKYNKNGIITGLLDSYCLVCESYLRDQNDISVHIDNHDHVRNLESTPYFEKYKDDHIRKVKMGYYCDFCNRLFSTATKVGLHISDMQHSYNKGLQSLIRTSDSVIAFGNILISDDAWNSIVDETCLICNTEFQSASIHKTSQTHVLNLIKINVDFIDNSLYRKIDKETFHCLTCNEVLAFRKFKDHFDSSDHKIKHQKCSDLGIKLDNQAASNQIKEEKPMEETAADVNRNTFKNSKLIDVLLLASATNSKTQATGTKTTKNPKECDAILLKGINANKDYIKEHGELGLMYCIVCEWLLEKIEIPIHVIGEHHITLLKMHKDRLEKMSKIEKKSSKDLSTENVKSLENNNNRDKILDSLPDLSLNFDAIKTHIDEHKLNPNKKKLQPNPILYNQKGPEATRNESSYTKSMLLKRNESNEPQNSRSCHSSNDDAEIEAFVAKNNMSYSNRRVFCNSCQTYLPPSIKNMKQHVDGANHKSNVTKPIAVVKKKSQDVKKVRTCDFVTSMVRIENMYFQDMVINENLCVNVLSFLLLKLHNFEWKCHCCDSTFGAEQIDKHKMSESHKTSLSETVILVIESEFIREIRSEVYHCGFCNIIESDWDGLQEHLHSVQHRECKNAAEWRLRQHKPQISTHEKREEMQMLAFLHMMAAMDNSSDSESDL